jgi:hypothetical protein
MLFEARGIPFDCQKTVLNLGNDHLTSMYGGSVSLFVFFFKQKYSVTKFYRKKLN